MVEMLKNMFEYYIRREEPHKKRVDVGLHIACACRERAGGAVHRMAIFARRG